MSQTDYSSPAPMRDYYGKSLAPGDTVRAWWDGEPYEAVVQDFVPCAPQDDHEVHHWHLVLVRGDGALMPSTSDAVEVLGT